jgi:hypothetical protein
MITAAVTVPAVIITAVIIAAVIVVLIPSRTCAENYLNDTSCRVAPNFGKAKH